MRFLIMHGSVVRDDAIGADMLGMHDALAESHECCLYGESVRAEGRRSLSRAEAAEFLSQPGSVAIYHHSTWWPDGEELLASGRARAIIRYHNVTPPSFFADAGTYWEACARGREQTYRLAHRFREALWLSTSAYNLAELGLEALPNRAVVPPFISMLTPGRAAPNASLLKELVESPDMNVLMVGRIAPNKGHLLFLRVLQAYSERYGPDIRGVIVGKTDPQCVAYCESVFAEAERLGVCGNLRYTGALSENDLLTYYLGCDAYLCCSDHEGFCVPVVEAQAAHLPVAAKSIGAVKETIGPAQILLGDDPADYADSLHRLFSDRQYWTAVVERGYANYGERFAAGRVAAAFTGALRAHLGTES